MADGGPAVANPTPTQSRGGSNRGRRGKSRGGRHPQSQRPSQTAQNSTQQPTTSSGRRFGGQLTNHTPDTTLRADALSFVPASVVPTAASISTRPPKSTPKSIAPPPRQRRFSRSTAPDLATRIQDDIAHNLYECAICSNEIARNSKVWSCHSCWTVFHIGCIKKWSKNDGSAVHRQGQDGTQETNGKQWRCPGCNLPQDSFPSAYTCWCEKELDPKVITGLPPHSCGQTCGRDRKFPKTCPHPCDQLCHAGPCAPCTSMGPQQSCFCGKQSSSRRCLETNYEAGWSCGEVCGDIMPCGEHTCDRPCHEGLCGACPVQVDAKCYCGNVGKSIPCSDRDDDKESYGWTGVFNCGAVCGRQFDCGKHKCEQTCHPQDQEAPHCPRSPDAITKCPCGKSSLASLDHPPRTECTDPIPSCNEPCAKSLSCGHRCTTSCHIGDCPPCRKTIPFSCRCGRNQFETACYGRQSERPWCMRTCRVTLNCGRHECGERCCPGERPAAERLAAKRKKKPFVTIDGTRLIERDDIEAEHICTQICGRPLKCGNHTCQELCHKGQCGSCKEAIFEDISCNCGRTVLTAPLPCGTRPPPCTFSCRRSKTCGHPQVAHNCHQDSEECPKCPFLTEKPCLCGKKTLKNQPCWRSDVLCGLVCGATLKCGSHFCRKTCHKPRECEDAITHCQQECGKPKKTCRHPCEQPCHAPASCKEDKSCPFKVIITCDCQRKKEEVRCNARAGVPDPPSRQNSLKCDDECARLERNRKLAVALNISDDHVDEHIPYSTATLNLYVADVAWSHEQEEVLRIFAADTNEKRLRFKPMKPRQRAFLHSLAEDFGFDGESLDPEPHRHVLLFKTPKFVAAPMKTLAQAARIRRAQLNTPQPVATDTTNTTSTPRADEVTPPTYNGILLRKPRFALTEDELLPTLEKAAPSTSFQIIFLSATDGIALIPKNEWSDPPDTISTLLETLHPTMSTAVTNADLASATTLCDFDLSASNPEPRILQTADTLKPSTNALAGATRGTGAGGGGWSQVAARRAAPMLAPTVPAVGQRSSFTVLGSKVAEAKRRQAEEKAMEKRRREILEEGVVEDWSAEVEGEGNDGRGAGSGHEEGDHADVDGSIEA